MSGMSARWIAICNYAQIVTLILIDAELTEMKLPDINALRSETGSAIMEIISPHPLETRIKAEWLDSAPLLYELIIPLKQRLLIITSKHQLVSQL